ncbi:MAG: hypothetical protein JST20_05845 [Bacteroidetes bacterium]|nr:hypothetical protein [Bacteroidota bacterium]
MLTLNLILKEVKDVPVNRLEELYEFVHSLAQTHNQNDSLRKKILDFGGAFSDMSSKDYADFIYNTKQTRTELFNRNINL